ncbi:MAG TPA: TonB-dependent receptor [Myxococcaceae bacterium]|nr:TonB-dependent receptor [Myxococcaceae bacterium]
MDAALGALCALLLTAAPTAPQDAPTALPPVDVPAPPEPAPPAPDAAARRDPSGSVTVIPVSDRPAQARDAAELLAQAPGVLVQDLGGLGQTKSLSIRGAPSGGVLVLLDGIPLNGAGGIAELSRVPLALADSLEVLRGGAGARYGSGGLGGVVNVLTPDPHSGAAVRGEMEGGSFGTALAQLSAEGPLLGGAGLVLLHGGTTRGDFTFLFDPTPQLPDDPLVAELRANNGARWGGALLKYRRDVAGWATSTLLELSADRRGLAGTVDYPTPDAREDGRRLAAGARAEHPLGDSGTIALRAFYKDDDSAFTGGYFGTLQDQHLRAGGLSADATWLLGGSHAFSGTVELGGEALEDSTGINPAWGKAAAMAMDEVLLPGGRVVLAPSLRVERIGAFATLSPKLGLTATLPWALELRANAGQAHRAPSFLELYVIQGTLLPNPDLRPERALFADAALSRRWAHGSLTAGGFGSLYEDLISYEYYPPFLARAFNFATAAVYGAEASGQLEFPYASATAAYTLLFSRNLRDEPRYYLKELPYRPRHTLRAAVTAGPRWLQGRVELSAQSEQFTNRTEENVLPARALVNASVEVELPFARSCRATVEMKNALDAQVEDVDGYPLPGRAFYVGLKAQLGGTGTEGKR